ncbi:MAG: hypothetical protein ACREHG_02815 [Candidatus Saccharimonadales bacterium]
MKKEVANIIRRMGGNPKYSGKDKTMYVHDMPKNAKGAHRPELTQRLFEVFTSLLIELDPPFKIIYQ